MVPVLYFPRLQAEMASYRLTQNDLPRARICARVSLEAAERTSRICPQSIVDSEATAAASARTGQPLPKAKESL